LFRIKQALLLCLLFFTVLGNCQLANYVSNGSFEEYYSCSPPNHLGLAKGWRNIDSAIFAASAYVHSCSGLIPYNALTFQWPRTGNAYAIASALCESSGCSTSRGYFRNRLKSKLNSGSIYCVTFYINISNNSSYGVDAVGAYFSDGSIDTITKSGFPLTYITPQIQNTNGNIITDTLKWIKISQTFTASGNEKHLVIGNFKSDSATNKLLINPDFLPSIATDILVDDVSCIDVNLPAFAGRDTAFKPGDSLFLGRQPDVGIDEACIWYKLPGTIPKDTIAGFWIKPVVTSTYVVRQEICGLVKWDTVVVTMNTLTVIEVDLKTPVFNIYPSPANDFLTLDVIMDKSERSELLEIYNPLGECVFNKVLRLNIGSNNILLPFLPDGFYLLKLGENGHQLSQPLLIQH
jgi:hypothetical protein